MAPTRWHQLIFGSWLAYLVSARLGFLAVNHEYFGDHPWELLHIWKGGLVHFAGALGSIAFFPVFTSLARVPRAQTLDVLARCTAVYWAVEGAGDALFGFAPFAYSIASASICVLILGGLLWWQYRSRRHGEAALLFAIGAAAKRFLLSPLDDRARAFLGPLDTVQVVSGFLSLALFVVFLAWRGRAPQREGNQHET
jgi:prolipoprotein diacylglyceryltransferase